MVREIIHVQIGQCGNQIGNGFWETITKEHQLSNDGKYIGDMNNETDKSRLELIHTYFQETQSLKFIPRAVLVDMEPGMMDMIKMSPLGKLYKPDNFIFGAMSSYNQSPLHMIITEGTELLDEIMNIIRKDAESCDAIQGFQLTHSIGGKTGSYLGALNLLKIRDEYPDKVNITYSVFPSKYISDVVIEPYQSILCIHQLLENTDQVFVFDNNALYNISLNTLKQKEPKYKDLNWIISMTMSGITASFRFDVELNCTMNRMGVNLIPFPRLHFLSLSQAPLLMKDNNDFIVPQITDQMWTIKNFLSDLDEKNNGKYLATTSLYRGDIEYITNYMQIIDGYINQIYNDDTIIPDSVINLCHLYYDYGYRYNSNDFINWIPHQNKTSVVKLPIENTKISATLIANTTGINSVFKRISSQFEKMYKRKAFLHWYIGEGFDEMEFQESHKNVKDLMIEYNDKQDAVIYVDNDEENEAFDEEEDD